MEKRGVEIHIASGVKLWVDADRRYGKRYTVGQFDESGKFLGYAIETDSEDEIQSYLRDHWEEC